MSYTIHSFAKSVYYSIPLHFFSCSLFLHAIPVHIFRFVTKLPSIIVKVQWLEHSYFYNNSSWLLLEELEQLSVVLRYTSFLYQAVGCHLLFNAIINNVKWYWSSCMWHDKLAKPKLSMNQFTGLTKPYESSHTIPEVLVWVSSGNTNDKPSWYMFKLTKLYHTWEVVSIIAHWQASHCWLACSRNYLFFSSLHDVLVIIKACPSSPVI